MTRTRKLADLAIMVAIGLVLNLATFPPLAFFGRISFVYGFCYLAGAMLGPVNGMIAAVMADILGYLMNSHGGPFVPQIMMTNGLMALFAGLSYKFLKWKSKELRIIPAAVVSFFLLTLGLSAWGEASMLFYIYPYTLAKTLGESLNITSPYLMIIVSKSITQPLWISLNVFITIIVLKRLKFAREQFYSSLEYYRAEVKGSKVNEDKIEEEQNNNIIL